LTIGIGWSCPEGVGLLTDSMNNISDDRGRYLALPGSRSFHRLPAVKAVAVVSGNLIRPLSDVDQFCLTLDAATVEAAARRLYDEVDKDDTLLRLTWPMYEQLKLGTGGTPQVLVAGGKDRDSLRVVALNPQTVESISWPEPAFAVVGAWVPYFTSMRLLESTPPPATLADCLQSAVAWGRGYLTSIYAGRSLEQMQREGMNPTVGYPLRAITFDEAGSVREYEITEAEVFELEVERD
jgi:hypothetical protein